MGVPCGTLTCGVVHVDTTACRTGATFVLQGPIPLVQQTRVPSVNMAFLQRFQGHTVAEAGHLCHGRSNQELFNLKEDKHMAWLWLMELPMYLEDILVILEMHNQICQFTSFFGGFTSHNHHQNMSGKDVQ
mmetsp:Transcript_54391/g.132930  ORF Transcript_54391/g.132930 Transcript_54391/m.132930 type:complete len:131 (+) Transcript_54391:1100-1492(+)